MSFSRCTAAINSFVLYTVGVTFETLECLDDIEDCDLNDMDMKMNELSVEGNLNCIFIYNNQY
jgi:hypothetical protein